ncbi:hypothetical protein ABW21_db0204082 [Orbilia brochopaga]|nr:hypothetical protein ABW21_db0204082 [Drechslerella brochopaga]
MLNPKTLLSAIFATALVVPQVAGLVMKPKEYGIERRQMTTTTTTLPDATFPTPPPGLRGDGQPDDCNGWRLVQSGDTCYNVVMKMVQRWHTCAGLAGSNYITVKQLTDWNPALGSPSSCTLTVGYYVCVHLLTPAPVPIPDDQASDCSGWKYATAGTTCEAVVSKVWRVTGLTLSSLVELNPSLGTVDSCAITKTAYLCVVTQNPDSPPKTAPGTIGTCNGWRLLQNAWTCAYAAQSWGITQDQLEAWNTIGSGASCSLNQGFYYCASVRPVSPPQALTGQPSNCIGWAVVRDGDTCPIIIARTNQKSPSTDLDDAKLHQYNPSLGAAPSCSLTARPRPPELSLPLYFHWFDLDHRHGVDFLHFHRLDFDHWH